MKKKKILVFLYRDFLLRYTIDTGTINYLTKKFDVNLIIDRRLAKKFKKILSKKVKINLYDFKSAENIRKKQKILNIFNIIRKLSSVNNGKYINSTTRVRQIQYKDQLRNQKIKYYFCLLVSMILNKSSYGRKIFNYLNQTLLDTSFFTKIIKKLKPNLVLIGSASIDHDALIALAAKKNNIPIASIIYSWDNPTTKGFSILKPDYAFSWNKSMTEDLVNFFEINKKNIFEIGILHWNFYRYIQSKKFKIPKNKLAVSFFSSSEKVFDNAFQNIRDILELNKDKKLIKKIFLIVRLHPNFYFKKSKKYLFEQKKILNQFKGEVSFINPKIEKLDNSRLLKFDLMKDLKEIKSILVNSKIVIGQYSTIQLEACIFNKPIINYSTGNFANTNYSKKSIVKCFTI